MNTSTTFKPRGHRRFAHQREGLRRLILQRGKAALLFDPGLGKSATVIDYMGVLALRLPQPEVRVLVACPLSAVDTWVQQVPRYAAEGVGYWVEILGGSVRERCEALAARGGHPFTARGQTRVPPRNLHVRKSLDLATSTPGARTPEDIPAGARLVVEVVNLDAFGMRTVTGSSTIADRLLEAVQRFSPDLMVIDESHKIKGVSSNVSRLMARIGPHVPRRVILTGTVMPHSPLDVFAQWRFLDPLAFGDVRASGRRPATFTGFRNRYARMGGYMGKQVVGFRNLDHMQEIMSELAVVARKGDALDLPPTLDADLPVLLGSAESRVYAALRAKDGACASLPGGATCTPDSRLEQAMRLRQVTSGYVVADDGTTVSLGEARVRTIASHVHDALAGEHRVVIFAQFLPEIAALGEALQRPGTTVYTVTGATDTRERLRIRQEFGSDTTERIVLVAQIRTMSLSVNELVTASHAIFASLPLQRDDYVQARDRLNRLGQTRPVTFWHAVAPRSVDEVILQSHRDRTNLETAMLRYIEGTETADEQAALALAST